MVKITDEDLEILKNSVEGVAFEESRKIAETKASAYVAIETINQLRNNTKNNLMFTILGGFLGFISSLTIMVITQNYQKEETKELNKQLLEVKKQLSDFQMYYSKKDSLQISSKKR
jgi:hypothetical protein